ncbi:MAG: amidohydrolase family protein [Armatimonadetes bacterium]|nr:amidohydrolase family protein [Armatimonadota bacterium]
MTLRPFGIVLNGTLELGLEVELYARVVAEIRPHRGVPDPYILSPAFVNAHSHLEYRGLQGAMQETQWWPWVREITDRKREQKLQDVRRDALLAAQENVRTGVGLIGEHTDRPVSAEALEAAKLPGVLFQEVITFFEAEAPAEKLRSVAARAEEQRRAGCAPVFLNPHAVYTVDQDTLSSFGASSDPISLHLAESPEESRFTREGAGPIAEMYRRFGVPYKPTGKSVYETARDLGLVRPGAQLVHCCDLSPREIEDLAQHGAKVAHCPRSNQALGCPAAKVREMLDAGVMVGLGMDSPASGGPIDMFEEMRAALAVSASRGAGLSPEEVWRMATSMGAASLGRVGWEIQAGANIPLIKVHLDDASATEDVILRGSPTKVERV